HGWRADGVLSTFMNLLPQAGSEDVSEQILRLLYQRSKSQGSLDAALMKYLTDDAPARRGMAAFLVAALGTPDQRKELLPKLDQQPFEVRLQAARGYLAAGDRTAIPLLLDVLARGPLPLAARAHERLESVAEAKAPTTKLPTTKA